MDQCNLSNKCPFLSILLLFIQSMSRTGATIRPTRRSPREQGKRGRKNDQKRGAKLIKVVVTKDKNGDNFSLEKYSV